MQQKISKSFFVSEIIASELVSLNILYEEQDTFHRQPMCQQEVPTFFTSRKESFSNSIYLEGIDEYDQGALTQISTELRHVCHFAGRRII